ncbi:MAG TPA: hypothetical protein PKC44_13460 [Agitococcus sp.]|nr:hypothetical protein [Agitococcus sp.]
MANRNDLIIWDADVYGAPDDYNAQSLHLARLLAEQAAEPSKKLLAFARDIEQQGKSKNFPPAIARYLTNFEAKVKASNTAAYCFNLPEYNWYSLVKIVLKTAKKHGLVLLGEELVLVLLANGSITPPQSEEYWLQALDERKRKNDFPETLDEFHDLLTERMGALLATHDFILETNNVEDNDEIYMTYIRKISEGHHEISLHCQGGDSEFELMSFFTIVENTMIEIAKKSDFQYSMISGGGVWLEIAKILPHQESKFRINNIEAFEELVFALKQTSLKWSDSALDIQGIDALINGDTDKRVRESAHQDLFMPYALIVARLAGNPDFEHLAVSLSPQSSKKSWPANTKSPNAWPNLVQYLRDNVRPFVGIITTEPEYHNDLANTLIEFAQLFKTTMTELLKPHSFEYFYGASPETLTDAKEFQLTFIRNLSNSSHKLIFDCFHKNGEFIFTSVNLQLFERETSSVLSNIGCHNWSTGWILLNIAQTLDSNQYSFVVNDKKSFEEFVLLIKQSAVVWSNSSVDFKGIDALFNGDIDERVKKRVHHVDYMPHALIAARLANNPQFENLAISLAPTQHDTKRWPAPAKIDPFETWPKLVQYLRDEVKPLA